MSSRLVSYDEIPESGGSLRLVFEDGNTAMCDLLIGADGIKSIVRKKFVADHHSTESGQVPNADPMWSGTFAYRCMIESKLIAEQMPNHRILTTPIIVSHHQCNTRRMIYLFVQYCGKNKVGTFINSIILSTSFSSIIAHSRVPISTRPGNQRAGVFI